MKRIVPIALVLAVVIVAGVYFVQQNRVVQPEPQVAAPGAAVVGETYTLEQVALHNTPTDCWAIINEGVYDLTPWVSQHPGGPEAIGYLCGKDGTTAFESQHGDKSRPLQALASFKIGSVAK